MIDLLAAAIIAMRSPQLAPIDTTTVIEEDSVGPDGKSLWDCRTMGDLRCGPGTTLPDGSVAAPGDYSDPNCWPGAVYCPPAGTPIDTTVIEEP